MVNICISIGRTDGTGRQYTLSVNQAPVPRPICSLGRKEGAHPRSRGGERKIPNRGVFLVWHCSPIIPFGIPADSRGDFRSGSKSIYLEMLDKLPVQIVNFLAHRHYPSQFKQTLFPILINNGRFSPTRKSVEIALTLIHKSVCLVRNPRFPGRDWLLSVSN